MRFFDKFYPNLHKFKTSVSFSIIDFFELLYILSTLYFFIYFYVSIILYSCEPRNFHMISGANYRSVEIYIKTYKHNIAETMNEERPFDRRNCKSNQNRYICSICLNQKPSRENKNMECTKRKSKSCPICQKNYDCENTVDQIDDNDSENNKNIEASHERKDKFGKNIQTSQPDVTQGMSLLNEVLTVFQTKKHAETKKDKSCKTIILKDACVGTEDKKKLSKLTMTKVFSCSIEENNRQNNKFVIVNCQPETSKASQFSLDLMHRKSSSMPQMKLEELKKSLKEKTKSKDAIEEVNRMFATVRKSDLNEKLEAPNRPIVRSGPRVLPVVKTNNESAKTDNENTVLKNKAENTCRCCQTNYKMSSGDSFECCHRNDRCDDCFYMMCCHYQHRLHSEAACQNYCKNCEHNKNPNIHT